MGSILAILVAEQTISEVTVTCKLVVAEDGTFAAYVPLELQFLEVLDVKLASLQFAKVLVDKVTRREYNYYRFDIKRWHYFQIGILHTIQKTNKKFLIVSKKDKE